MTHDWITTLLALGFFAATAAFFVMWSKRDEERDRRWGEISRAATIEKEKDAKIEMLKAKVAVFENMADHLAYSRDALQDRLSAILCPTNNHVWKDGVCVKCGRVKDD